MTRHQSNSGFTLIELLVVMGVLGIIMSIALASYSSYIETARGGTIKANFEIAVNTAKNNFAAARQLTAIGASINSVIPASSAGWADMMNTSGSQAPEGGDPFEPGLGNVTNGAVGVQYVGAWSNRDAEVIITRPTYSGVPGASEIIRQADY
ncbi:MAG: type II secretion system protein [Pseudomonadota bacterium]